MDHVNQFWFPMKLKHEGIDKYDHPLKLQPQLDDASSSMCMTHERQRIKTHKLNGFFQPVSSPHSNLSG